MRQIQFAKTYIATVVNQAINDPQQVLLSMAFFFLNFKARENAHILSRHTHIHTYTRTHIVHTYTEFLIHFSIWYIVQLYHNVEV